MEFSQGYTEMRLMMREQITKVINVKVYEEMFFASFVGRNVDLTGGSELG